MTRTAEKKEGAARRTVFKGALGMAALGALAGTARAQTPPKTGRIEVRGLPVYYEDHGADRGLPPVVLLHGGVLAIETSFTDDLLPRLAATRRVIAIEAQGHGHTPDRPTPLSEEQLVGDVVGVLEGLGVSKADFVGHSMGGMTSIGTAVRRPDLVRSLVVLSCAYRPDGMLAEMVAMQGDPTHVPSAGLVSKLPTAEHFARWSEHYQRTAPDPAAFQPVIGKLQAMMAAWPGWTQDQMRAIRAPALFVVGDRDFVRVDHAAELAGLPADGRLAVLPATTHMEILDRGAWLEPMMQARWADLPA